MSVITILSSLLLFMLMLTFISCSFSRKAAANAVTKAEAEAPYDAIIVPHTI